MSLITLTWPSTLPQSPLVNTTRIQPMPNRVVFGGDVGRPQVRQRYPTGSLVYGFTMLMTEVQHEVFQTFFWGQCASGSLRFWHRDWRRGDTVLWNWHPEDPFDENETTPIGWEISMQWIRARP